jgi:diketogulonate reductase-like aldo/keto reductase
MKEGKAKSIGVSNYGIEHLEEMRVYAKVWPPAVNQIELHPWCQQRELVSYCEKEGIIVQAYSPLVTGTKLADPALVDIASKHGKSPAQVLIRYCLQKKWVPLPKSSKSERIKENADVFGFELSAEDVAILDGMDEGPEGAIFKKNAT